MTDQSATQRFAGLTKLLAGLVAVLLVGSILLAITQRDGRKYLTADFAQVNALYKGAAVKILGVPVGRVESLEARGDKVRVKISYKDDIKLPSDVKAVVVSPAIVGDRFVQFAPAYSGGAVLKDNATLSMDSTRVPVELDTIYKSLDDLSLALGPKGANSDGALSSLIDDTAKQLDGQGAQLNQTIRDFGKLSSTLSNNREELFGSMSEVNQFVDLLKKNDSTVRSFNASTADLSKVLDAERDDLGEALKQLSLALVDVNKLVKDNRGELRDNIANIRTLSDILADHKEGLKEITIAAPTALANVALSYNPITGTLDSRSNLGEILNSGQNDPGQLLCNLLGQTSNEAVCNALGGVLGQLTDLMPRSTVAETATYPGPVQGSLNDLVGVR